MGHYFSGRQYIKSNIDSLCLELMIPGNANVYYAINTAHDLNFVLRTRRRGETETPAVKGERRRDTSKARRKLLGLAL